MELWIVFVVIGQLLNAAVVLVDKYIVDSPQLPDPPVFSFYVSALSIVAVVTIPFGVTVPNLWVLLFSFLSAICFLGAILSLYSAFKNSDASDATPIVGAFSAISAFLLSFWLIGTLLPVHFVWGFGMLVLGMIIISRFRFNTQSFLLMIFAGLLFGASSVWLKFIFFHTDLINGYFWSRMANVAVAPLVFLIPGTFQKVFLREHTKKETHRFGFLILLSKTFAGIAFFFILEAIRLGDVAIVNALSGLQFVFLLFFALIFSRYFPNYFRETSAGDHRLVLNKVVGVAFVVAGFFMLFMV